MILAVSDADTHLDAVTGALARLGADVATFDTGLFPSAARLSIRPGGRAFELVLPGGRTVCERDLTAIWWRRPRPARPPPGLVPGDRGFALRQAEAALAGLWSMLDGVRWVNEPWRDDAAGHKPRQLAAARRVGLAVPDTLVTSDPAAARAFLDTHGAAPVVHKALHATPEDWRTTGFVGPVEREHLGAVALSPVILQPFIPGVDVRATLVGGRILAAEIDARGTGSPEDFRPVFEEAEVRAVDLPPDVAARLRALVADLGLAYAAVDLRRRDDGEHVFLEANPSGQFLFVEERTGLPIADALASLLASGKA